MQGKEKVTNQKKKILEGGSFTKTKKAVYTNANSLLFKNISYFLF